jgi:hypothetical protein
MVKCEEPTYQLCQVPFGPKDKRVQKSDCEQRPKQTRDDRLREVIKPWAGVSPFERPGHAFSSTLGFIGDHKKLFQFVYTESKYSAKNMYGRVLRIGRGLLSFWPQMLKEARQKKSIKVIGILRGYSAHLMVFLPLLC